MKTVAIIGAGAAGCFIAQRLKELCDDLRVELYESHSKPLAKVAITGGGRCNLTNTFAEVGNIKQVYPRGHKLLKRLMHRWSQHDTMRWFEGRGVPLVVQDDQCVFPVSQDAMQIVRTLAQGLTIHLKHRIKDLSEIKADYIVVTTGGGAAPCHGGVMADSEPLVPSLFPFRLEPTGLEELMGIVVDSVTLTLAGTKLKSHGTLLITHFGISGPATLRLSSYGARHLAEQDYKAPLVVNWLGETSQSEALEMIDDTMTTNPDKRVTNIPLRLQGIITQRHWTYLMGRAGIQQDTRWKALNQKQQNRLVTVLLSDTYNIIGRAPHKEEFVTCGGVSLSSVDATTLESKQIPRLYFAGEVLDIDGVTGGFNLQAAFTTGNAVAEAISAEVMG